MNRKEGLIHTRMLNTSQILASVTKATARKKSPRLSSSLSSSSSEGSLSTISPTTRTSGLFSNSSGTGWKPHKAAPRSYPRTKLPFLQQVVKRAMQLPSSSHPALLPPPSASALSCSSFSAYPLLGPRETKQANGSCVLYRDEVCVLVNDAFPKSTVHCLLLPLDTTLTCLNDLHYAPTSVSEMVSPTEASKGSFATVSSRMPGSAGSRPVWERPRNHVELLEHMSRVADAYVQFLKRHDPAHFAKRRFITGFHGLPSLPQLHMHLLSMDLESPCLKNKKHYNSFATYFFLTTDRIIDDLKLHKKITLNQDTTTLLRFEEQAMKCLWCGCSLKDMPSMKKHVPLCPLNKSCMP